MYVYIIKIQGVLSEMACPYILRENHISFAPPCTLKKRRIVMQYMHWLGAAISLCEGTYTGEEIPCTDNSHCSTF